MTKSKEQIISEAMQTIRQEIAFVQYSREQTDLTISKALLVVFEAGRAQGIRDSIDIVERNHINTQEVA